MSIPLAYKDLVTWCMAVDADLPGAVHMTLVRNHVEASSILAARLLSILPFTGPSTAF